VEHQASSEELAAESFKKFLEEDSPLRDRYMGVEILCNHPKYTAIPTLLYTPDRALSVLSKVHSIDELDEIHSVELPHWQMTLIYTLNGTVMNLMKQYHPQFHSYHSIETYLKYLPYFKEHNKIFFQYFNGFSTIIVVEKTTLKFLNSFPTLHFTTALYHLLSVVNEVQFNPNHTTLYISGSLKEMEIFDLSNYFSQIKFFRNPELPLPDEHSELRYSTLLFDRKR